MNVGSIVVGVDGSKASAAALRWAIEEGRLRSTRVLAVTSWTYPTMIFADAYVLPEAAAIREEADAILETAIADATAGGEVPEYLDRRVSDGAPASTLLDLSAGASLVVVGARGHGGFVGLLVGSVATQVVNHAKCPVVVVPS